MADPILIATDMATSQCFLRPDKANRHGLITGATGTGKTITLQTMAEGFSRIGVPVFMADVKGDLTGISQVGSFGDKAGQSHQGTRLATPEFAACPTTLWDVFGEQGHPVRATVSDLGPLLLGRMLNLNETQAGVLQLVFKIADDDGLLLLDMKDLRAMCQQVGDNASRLHHRIRQHQRRQHRRHPARADADRSPGRRPVLWRAHAQHRRLHADRCQRPGRGQHPGGRQADELAAPVRHLFAVDAERTV